MQLSYSQKNTYTQKHIPTWLNELAKLIGISERLGLILLCN